MSMEIYYFSGTGNSLIVARDIAGKSGAKLISIPSLMDNENIIPNADAIGIVFPVYHAVLDGMPLMIKRFVGKLRNIESKYIFAVCTCKGWSRLTITRLGEIIATRSGKLAAGFTVPMPDNSGPTSVEERRKLFANWPDKLASISGYINARKSGKFENTVLFNLIMFPFRPRLEKMTLKLLNKLAGLTGVPFEEVLPLTDRSFLADEKCNGCGICTRLCPAGNITVVNNRPVWRNGCESCLACVNWCPQEAIQGGISATAAKTIRYRHPEAKMSDFILRNGQ